MKHLLIAMVVLLASCTQDDPPQTFDYDGTWNARFRPTSTDIDSGSAVITVLPNGNATGIVHSEVFNENYTLTGNVSTGGQITISAGTVTSGGSFIGTLSGNAGSGTWLNNTNPTKIYTGTWTAVKQ